MATIRVTNQASLLSALKTAQAGDTVLLADGNYGITTVGNDYTSAVTIKSEHPQGAVFEKLLMQGATNMIVDGIQVANGMSVEKGSAGITVINSDIDGVLYCRDVNGLKVDNVDVSGGQFGLLLNSVQNFSVTNSHIHDAVEDIMRVTGNSYNGVIENNVIANPTGGYPLHPDLLQLFAASGITPHDLVIRGNLMYDTKGDGETSAQGIFMSDPSTGGYKNILIEENLIRVPSPNTIYVNGGQQNVVVQNNSLMSTDSGGAGIIRLASKSGMDNSGVTVEGNIVKSIVDETHASHIGDNFIYGKDIDISTVFSGTDYTSWESFVPVSGSAVDFGSNYGAQATLIEAIGTLEASHLGEAWSQSAAPAVAIEDLAHLVFSHDDAIQLSGRVGKFLSEAHTHAMEQDEGSLSLTFNADTTASRRGLVSKDTAGMEDAVSAWIQDGKLIVRVQDGEKEAFITQDNITAHKDYDLMITFDDAQVKVWLDDALVGQTDMDLNLSGNHDALVLGAFNGKSSTGTTDNTQYFFDGTISDVSFYDKALTPAQLTALDAIHHNDALNAIIDVVA
jgi:hypothetical protein